MRRDGKLKPSEVAREFQITNRTSIDWLQRYEREGVLFSIYREQSNQIKTVYNHI